MDQRLTIEVAGAILGGILSPLLVTGLFRSVRWHGQRANLVRKQVVCPSLVKWFAMIATLFFAGITLLSCLYDKPNSQWTGLVAGGVVTLGAGLFWIDCAFRRLVYDEYQIMLFSAWRMDRHAAWEEIRDISYSPLCQWFVLDAGGRMFRVYEFMSGIREFIECAETRGIKAPPVLRQSFN